MCLFLIKKETFVLPQNLPPPGLRQAQTDRARSQSKPVEDLAVDLTLI